MGTHDDAFAMFLASRDVVAVERERFPVDSAGLHHERPALRSPGKARLQYVAEEVAQWDAQFPECRNGHRLFPGAYYDEFRGAATYKRCKTCQSFRSRAAHERRVRARMKRETEKGSR